MILKDLKILLSDRKATAILIIMPLVLISILGTALKSSFLTDVEKQQIKVAIVTEYNQKEEIDKFTDFLKTNSFLQGITQDQLNEMTKSIKEINIENILIDEFLENDEVKKIISYEITDREKAKELLQKEKVLGVIIIPEDFVFNTYMNFLTPFRNQAKITVLGHPNKYISSQIIEGIMKSFTDGLSSSVIGKNVFLETSLEEGLGFEVFNDIESIVEDMNEGLVESNFEINHITTNERKPISGIQYYASSMISMFVLFSASYGGKLLLQEKKDMTYQRMIVSGIERWKIIGGKFFTIFLLALVQTIIIILATSLIYRVRWGNMIYVSLISLCTVFSIAGVGILISALTLKSNTFVAADVFQSVFINGMALIGGSFIPVDSFPAPMKVLSNFTINGLSLKAYQRVMMDFSIEKIAFELLGLVAMGIVFIVSAIFVMKVKKGGKDDVKHNKTATAEV